MLQAVPLKLIHLIVEEVLLEIQVTFHCLFKLRTWKIECIWAEGGNSKQYATLLIRSTIKNGPQSLATSFPHTYTLASDFWRYGCNFTYTSSSKVYSTSLMSTSAYFFIRCYALPRWALISSKMTNRSESCLFNVATVALHFSKEWMLGGLDRTQP